MDVSKSLENLIHPLFNNGIYPIACVNIAINLKSSVYFFKAPPPLQVTAETFGAHEIAGVLEHITAEVPEHFTAIEIIKHLLIESSIPDPPNTFIISLTLRVSGNDVN